MTRAPAHPGPSEESLSAATRHLRVAVVHDWLNGMRGGEMVLREILALLPHAEVHTLLHEPGSVDPAIEQHRIVESPLFSRLSQLRPHYRRLLPILPAAVSRLETARADLLISTSHCVAHGAPPPRSGLHLSYIHSPMRYVWDHFEDYLGQGLASDLALRAARRPLQRWDRRAAAGVDKYAANSRHIAGRVARCWGRDADVIPPPVDTDFFTPNPGGKREDWFLVVAALVPYKRVDRAIEAAHLAGAALRIVGSGPAEERLRAMAGPQVRWEGRVDREGLRELYRRCRALVYPAAEDFGIAAVEAMACGAPVVALKAGGVAESVLEGETGMFFDSPDAPSLADVLTSLTEGAYLAESCRRRAEQYSARRFRQSFAQWAMEAVGKRF